MADEVLVGEVIDAGGDEPSKHQQITIKVATKAITPFKQRTVLEHLDGGVSLKTACEMAGVSYQLMRNLLSVCRTDGEGRYAITNFAEKVMRHSAKALADVERAAFEAAKSGKNAKMTLDYLERRDAEQWAPQRGSGVTVNIGSFSERISKELGSSGPALPSG